MMLFLFFWKLASCNLKSLPNSSADSVCSKARQQSDKQNYIITYTTTSTIWRVIYPEEQKLIRFLFICQESSIWFDLKLWKSPRLRNIVSFFSLSRRVTTDIMFQTRIFRGHLSSVSYGYPRRLPHKLTLMVLLCAFTSP